MQSSKESVWTGIKQYCIFLISVIFLGIEGVVSAVSAVKVWEVLGESGKVAFAVMGGKEHHWRGLGCHFKNLKLILTLIRRKL